MLEHINATFNQYRNQYYLQTSTLSFCANVLFLVGVNFLETKLNQKVSSPVKMISM